MEVTEKLINRFYSNYDEEGRLLSKHGQVEYLTTRKYIAECLEKCGGKRMIEIGAGTGRYSVTLAKEGYDVTAVELSEHNLEILRSKLNGSESITVKQGSALDLSEFEDGCFDLTLLLGPMYHLFTKEDKVKALSEAVRVTKRGGYILVAYCMNEPTVINYLFMQNNFEQYEKGGGIASDWRLRSDPTELFELIRTEEIAELDREVSVEMVKLVAADGATNYFRGYIDGLDDETFEKWLSYHFAICERQDLIGASHHTLDILKKR